MPAPVQRYLRFALKGNREIPLVRIQQIGKLRTDVRSNRWLSFNARHVAAPAAASFLWDARVATSPFLHIRVSDALLAGKGSGQVSLLSAFTIASDSGSPEMNAGSLHRFLAEAVWYPAALLPRPKLQWDPIDLRSAVATLRDGGISVSLEFRFAESGEVTEIFTPARWGRFEGQYKQAPWEGHFRKYEERAGIMIPTEGDVGWYLDDLWQCVWQARIVTFEIDDLFPYESDHRTG